MISRVEYDLISKSMKAFPVDQMTAQEAEECWRWTKPYIVVIHTPSHNGYYLDRHYRHIISVRDIGVPAQWVECELNHYPITIPPEFESVGVSDHFITYWLY